MAAQAQDEGKNSTGILWGIAGIFLLIAVIWWAFSAELKSFFLFLRMIELKTIYLVFEWLPFTETKVSLAGAIALLKQIDPSTLNLNIAEEISDYVGKFLRWPFTVVLLVFAYFSYARNIKMRYRKHYSIETLAKQESSEWPQINPVLNQNLGDQDLDHGAWAMAMPPLLFCRRNNLLQVAIDDTPRSYGSDVRFKAQLDKNHAEEIFSNQLGRTWRGVENLPVHRRALFSAFAARACRDSQASKDLITHINKSCKNGDINHMDFSQADILWKKHINNKIIQNIITKHAYEFTVFMALFLVAREDGVFACSDFLWLKPKDRRLWYVLNDVGRQTSFCETAGVHAHFLAERKLGRNIIVPVVKEAVVALEFALSEIIYVPTDEEREHLMKAAEEKGLESTT